MVINNDKTMPLVSIIVPCFNYGKYLSECLQSIKGQTYSNYEVIIVDDGSTDNSKEVAFSFLSDARFKYIYQENKGLEGARNTGICHSTGEFIAIVDPDDIWFPTKLDVQIEYMICHPNCGLVYSDAEIFIEGKRTGRTVRNGKLFYEGWCFEEMMMNNGVVSPSVLIRKECFRNVGLFDESEIKQCSGDWEMWVRIAYKYEFGSIKKPLLYYRIHENNMSGGNFKKHFENRLLTLKRHLPKLKDPVRKKLCFEHNLKEMFKESLLRKEIKISVQIVLRLLLLKILNKLL
jgi:glycosyltransferase involved in cell wall biosynthesis